MDVAPELNPSAFKHGINEADIRNAFVNPFYDDILDDASEKHCTTPLMKIPSMYFMQ
jgi:hypothetical protein